MKTPDLDYNKEDAQTRARYFIAITIAMRPVTAAHSLTAEDVRNYFQDAIGEAGNWAAYYLSCAMRKDREDCNADLSLACESARAHYMLVDAMGNDTMF